MNALLKLVGATAAAMVLGAVAVILLVPPTPEERAMFRQFEAEAFLQEVVEAVWAYHAERGAFPEGDGEGSAGLARALSAAGRDGRPYLQITEAMRSPEGGLRNPFAPEEVLHYRNNASVPNAAARNRSSFDLWGRGAGGADALNNWGGSVPLP